MGSADGLGRGGVTLQPPGGGGGLGVVTAVIWRTIKKKSPIRHPKNTIRNLVGWLDSTTSTSILKTEIIQHNFTLNNASISPTTFPS